MIDLGWGELLVVGIVALIVVGPKDLPILFRRVGQFIGKAKGMAREFSQAMSDAADESGMRDVSQGLTKSLKAATNPLGSAMDGVKAATKSLSDIDPNSETGKLSAKRAEEVKKIQAATARAALERKQREATEALAKMDAEAAPPVFDAAPEPPPAATKATEKTVESAVAKSAVKKAPAKAATAKPAAPKKPAVRKAAAKKSES